MATSREWGEAFLEQAKEDLMAAEAVAGAKDAPATLCMLLQMVFEKVAKAAFLVRGMQYSQIRGKGHKAASDYALIIKRQPRMLATLGGEHWRGWLPVIKELEEASPSIAFNGGVQLRAQLEFPWEDPAVGTIRVPARDLPIIHRIKNPVDRTGPKLMMLARALVNRFSEMNPA